MSGADCVLTVVMGLGAGQLSGQVSRNLLNYPRDSRL
jgi:hypothetical protein